MRTLYLLGFSYMLVEGGSILLAHDTTKAGHAQHAHQTSPSLSSFRYGTDDAKSWFVRVRPSCNALEVSSAITRTPPPRSWDGAGYAAACYALGGQIARARDAIAAIEPGMRAHSAAIVFELGHPVADAGDDVAAGPIMDLVLEFWPENYQALYHAGMSDYALERRATAKPKLVRFRELYRSDDYFGQSADKALARMNQGLGPDTPHPGAHP